MFRSLSAHAALTMAVALFAVGNADAQSLGSAAAQDTHGPGIAADDARGDEDGQSSRFGRMFTCRHSLHRLCHEAALVRMGARGQVLDAQDNLAAGPSRSSSIRC